MILHLYIVKKHQQWFMFSGNFSELRIMFTTTIVQSVGSFRYSTALERGQCNPLTLASMLLLLLKMEGSLHSWIHAEGEQQGRGSVLLRHAPLMEVPQVWVEFPGGFFSCQYLGGSQHKLLQTIFINLNFMPCGNSRATQWLGAMLSEACNYSWDWTALKRQGVSLG